MVFGGYGYRIEELGYTWTDEMFEEVENKIMKIKKWEDLHGFENEKCIIKKAHSCISIDFKNGDFISVAIISLEELENNTILSVLKLFGFDVEFVEEPKLTKRDRLWLEVMELNRDHSIKIEDEMSNIYISNHKSPFTNDLFRNLEIGKIYTIGELMKLEVGE